MATQVCIGVLCRLCRFIESLFPPSNSRPAGAVNGEVKVKTMMTNMTKLMCMGAVAMALVACPPPPIVQATCTPQSCANGCCSAGGQCITDETPSACGLNGLRCVACTTAQTCDVGVCTGSTNAGGGDGAGGGDASGGGDGDAGIDCATVALDAVLGTLTLKNGATVTQSAVLPQGILAVGSVGSSLYGLSKDNTIRSLGSLPALSLGPALASVLTQDDLLADAGTFLNGYLAANQTELLAGYTKSGAGYPGAVVKYDVTDGGTQYFNAPGNYTAAGFGNRFLINGVALEGAGDAGVYAIDNQGGFALATVESSWMPSNGVTGVTSNDVMLLGYYSSDDSLNHVRAVPPSVHNPAIQSRTPFALSTTDDVLAVSDLVGFTTFGTDAIVVHGGYQSSPPYSSFTISVDRVPLTLSGTQNQTVDAGAPVMLIEATDQCTNVVFASGNATTLLLGVQDRTGRRLLQITP